MNRKIERCVESQRKKDRQIDKYRDRQINIEIYR